MKLKPKIQAKKWCSFEKCNFANLVSESCGKTFDSLIFIADTPQATISKLTKPVNCVQDQKAHSLPNVDHTLSLELTDNNTPVGFLIKEINYHFILTCKNTNSGNFYFSHLHRRWEWIQSRRCPSSKTSSLSCFNLIKFEEEHSSINCCYSQIEYLWNYWEWKTNKKNQSFIEFIPFLWFLLGASVFIISVSWMFTHWCDEVNFNGACSAMFIGCCLILVFLGSVFPEAKFARNIRTIVEFYEKKIYYKIESKTARNDIKRSWNKTCRSKLFHLFNSAKFWFISEQKLNPFRLNRVYFESNKIIVVAKQKMS